MTERKYESEAHRVVARMAKIIVAAAGGEVRVPMEWLEQDRYLDIDLDEDDTQPGVRIYRAKWLRGAPALDDKNECVLVVVKGAARAGKTYAAEQARIESLPHAKVPKAERAVQPKIETTATSAPNDWLKKKLDDEGMEYEPVLAQLVRYGGMPESHFREKYPTISLPMLEEAMQLSDECPVCARRGVYTSGERHDHCFLPTALMRAKDPVFAKTYAKAKATGKPHVSTIATPSVPLAKALSDAINYRYTYSECPGHYSRSRGANCDLCGFPILQSGKDY